MKTVLPFATVLLMASASVRAADAATTWVDDYDTLLEKYVTSAGVKYKTWHQSTADRKTLGRVVNAISSEKLTGKSKQEKLAFYLNAYNAWILHRILEDYPTESPGGKDGLGKFFDSKRIKVAGKTTSFSLLENETIRPNFKEPRIHFALNCASASCPPLHGKAFRGDTLDATLQSLVKSFVNSNPYGVKSGGSGKVAISRIFEWYGDDFKSSGGPLSYINQYRTEPLLKTTKVSFQAYNWTLNEAR